MPALTPNSLIAVTGVTGYIGSHVALAALQTGHRVRGVVRSLEKAQLLKEAYVKLGIAHIDDVLAFVVVEDLQTAQRLEQALQGVDGIVHTAVPMGEMGTPHFDYTAVDIMLSVVRAASQVPSVKRVVITSSAAAAVTPGQYVDKVITGEDWNDEAVRNVGEDVASRKDISPLLMYNAAKTRSERAAWDFVKNDKPQFDLVSVLPYMNFGPLLAGPPKSTGTFLDSVLKNDGTPMTYVPPQWFLDVRDDGKLHLLCLTTPNLSGKRILAGAEPFGWNLVLSLLRKNFPDRPLPEDVSGPQGETDRQKADMSIATNLLGGWIGLEQGLVDFAKSIGC